MIEIGDFKDSCCLQITILTNNVEIVERYNRCRHCIVEFVHFGYILFTLIVWFDDFQGEIEVNNRNPSFKTQLRQTTWIFP